VRFLPRLTAFAALIGALTGASGAAADEVRRVEGLDFDRVLVVGDITVEVRQGDRCGLELRGDREDLDQDPFYVSRGRLILGKTRGLINRAGDGIRFRVVLPDLRELEVAGSGVAYVRSYVTPPDVRKPTRLSVEGSGDLRVYAFEGPSVALRVKGSGSLKVADLKADELKALVNGSGGLYLRHLEAARAEVVTSGSGDLRVAQAGRVLDLEVSVIGSGDATLEEVTVDVAELNVVGSGSVTLGTVSKALNVSILGSGDVRYAGEPEVDETILGSGELRRTD